MTQARKGYRQWHEMFEIDILDTTESMMCRVQSLVMQLDSRISKQSLVPPKVCLYRPCPAMALQGQPRLQYR